MRARWARTPVRVKLTAVYALAVAVALAAVGGIIFLRFESGLDRTIDADLRSRSAALAGLVAADGPRAIGGTAGAPLLRPLEAFAQVVAPDGGIVAATPPIAGRRILSAADVRRAAHRPLLVDRRHLRGVAKNARFAAVAVPRGHGRVVLVGRSLKDREGANESFARALLIGGPLALLLASVAGYGLAAAALRPVESMRRRAATISIDAPGERLPVPPADDEISRLGRTLNDMLGRLERAFAQQRALTANASHELRTPLAVLVSTLEVALRRDRDRDELEAALREALVEAQRLTDLAEALLVLAQADEGRLALAVDADVDLDEVALAVAGRFEAAARAEGRRVVALPSGCHVQADPLRLQQALTNLVDNALRHGAGTVTIEAHGAAGGDDAAVRVHVRDEGGGLSATFAEHAFDRFARGDAGGDAGGSGLGLSIVESIARAHGGAAGAASGPPGDVWITLPAAR